MSPPHKRYDLFDFYDDDSISDSSIIKLKPQLEPKAFVPPQEIVEEYMKQATVISPKIKESPRVAPIKGICHVCWHRNIRAVPIKEGEPCFNCGSVN